jgi:hypothetical protein
MRPAALRLNSMSVMVRSKTAAGIVRWPGGV